MHVFDIAKQRRRSACLLSWCRGVVGKGGDVLQTCVDIDLLVSRVRQRLDDDAREPRYIKTIRNEGDVFSMPVTIEEVRS
jgi:hypothetical protein